MDIKYINPFLEAAITVLEQLTKVNFTKGTLELRDTTASQFNVAVTIGVTGEIQGQVVYSFSFRTAKQIASKMMGGAPVTEFSGMAESAISELGNIITGNAFTRLCFKNIQCLVTPPSMIVGDNIRTRATQIQTIVIPLKSELGLMEICVGLEKNTVETNAAHK
jgi:chemotaxis protein CheX